MSQTKEEKDYVAYKKARAEYMREYNRKNKEKINAHRRAQYQKRKNDPEFRRQRKKANKKYHEKHRDEINARAKARNWNYDPEKAKVKRDKHYKKHPARQILRARKCFAKKNELDFNLTEDWYYEEFEKGCSATKIPFDDPGSDTPWVAHIDRIDSAIGYIPENCRLVCACYNIAKKHWTDKDVLKMAKALINESNK